MQGWSQQHYNHKLSHLTSSIHEFHLDTYEATHEIYTSHPWIPCLGAQGWGPQIFPPKSAASKRWPACKGTRSEGKTLWDKTILNYWYTSITKTFARKCPKMEKCQLCSQFWRDSERETRRLGLFFHLRTLHSFSCSLPALPVETQEFLVCRLQLRVSKGIFNKAIALSSMS